MKWQRRRDGEGLRWEAYHKDLRFVARGVGGFITVRHYILSVYVAPSQSPTLSLTFYRLKDAQAWADEFTNVGKNTVDLSMVIPVYV